MVEIMETNLVMASGIFGRCETCMKNLRKSICSFNCLPTASQYITPYTAEVEVNNQIGMIFKLHFFSGKNYIIVCFFYSDVHKRN